MNLLTLPFIIFNHLFINALYATKGWAFYQLVSFISSQLKAAAAHTQLGGLFDGCPSASFWNISVMEGPQIIDTFTGISFLFSCGLYINLLKGSLHF